MPLVRTIDATPTGRARATITNDSATISESQKARSPSSGSRSVRCSVRVADGAGASADVAATPPRLPHPDDQQQQPGSSSSGRNAGAAKRRPARSRLVGTTVYAQPLRIFWPDGPASSASCRSSGIIGTIILNFFASLSCGGAPAWPCTVRSTSRRVTSRQRLAALQHAARAGAARTRSCRPRLRWRLGAEDVGVALGDRIEPADDACHGPPVARSARYSALAASSFNLRVVRPGQRL